MFPVSRYTEGDEYAAGDYFKKKRAILLKVNSRERSDSQPVTSALCNENEESGFCSVQEENEEGSSLKELTEILEPQFELENQEEVVQELRGEKRAGEDISTQDAMEISDLGLHEVEDTKGKVQKKIYRPKWLESPRCAQHCASFEEFSFDPLLVSSLEALNIKQLFPIQAIVLDELLKSPYGRTHDYCVSAPTGCGKTLAYLLPVIHILWKRTFCKLHTLIVLPTRDLARQVKTICDHLCQGTSLRVGLMTGQHSFSVEQSLLIGGGSRDESVEGPLPYYSLVDILICTPGRLVDHLDSTPGFSLSDLNFLIIDEADRLLNQSYFNWLAKVDESVLVGKLSRKRMQDPSFDCVDSSFPEPSGIEMNRLCTPSSFLHEHFSPPFQKLLFSATLTRNPEKLSKLNLKSPIFIVNQPARDPVSSSSPTVVETKIPTGGHLFCTPETLEEFMIVCTPGEKPLILLYYLKTCGFERTLCFTSSVESTHRLYLLLKFVGDVSVAEYSSSLSESERNQMLREFSSGNISMLICSDVMARGMDIENVRHVISYDAPVYIKTYIHRVGRTARAGNPGKAFTMVDKSQVRHFKKMIAPTGKKPSSLKISQTELEPFVEPFEEALVSLKEAVRKEKLRSG